MDTELVLSVGEFMFRQNILTPKGLDFLYDLRCDPIQDCLYHSVVLRMTEMYGEIVEKRGIDKTAYQRLRKVALNSYIQFYTSKKKLSLVELREYHTRRDMAFISI
jgi:hypothetical protein